MLRWYLFFIIYFYLFFTDFIGRSGHRKPSCQDEVSTATVDEEARCCGRMRTDDWPVRPWMFAM